MRHYKLTLLGSILSFFSTVVIVNAQHFHVSSYTQDDGLPMGEIYGVAQDELGFVWIASDEGLIRFDGERFKVVQDRPCKDVFLESSGKVVALHSKHLWEIHSLPENPSLEKRLSYENLGLLESPKLFEDHLKTLWAYGKGEVLRLSNGPTAVYNNFPNEKLYLAEGDQGELWVLTESGKLFRHHPAIEAFESLDYSFPKKVNAFVHGVGSGFWVSAEDGVWQLSIDGGSGKVDARRAIDIEQGATFVVSTNIGVFVGSEKYGLLRMLPLGDGQIEVEEVEDHTFPHSTRPLPFRKANNPFADQEGGLWLATEYGVARLTPNIFDAVDAVPKGNVFDVIQLDNGEIYNAQGRLFKILKRDEQLVGEAIETSQNVTALASYKNDVWIGTFDGKVGRLGSSGKPDKLIGIRDSEGLIFNLEADPLGNIWVCQSPNPATFNGIAKVAASGSVKYYSEKEGFKSRVLVSRVGKDQQLYFGGVGDEHYLYKYDPVSDQAVDLSVPLPFKHKENFEVHDLHADYMGAVWLATTDGLLRYKDGVLTHMDLGPQMSDTEIRGIDLLDDGTLWVATDVHGIVKYAPEGGYTAFSEHNGLTTNISNYRAVMTGQDGSIWIGTSEGLEVSQLPNPIANPTLPPMLTGIRLTDDFIEPHEEHVYRVPSHSYMALGYLTLVFSTEEMLYQTRITELGMAWSEPSSSQELVIPSLDPGEYHFEVRAKEKSGHRWSEPSSFVLNVYTVWYLSNLAYAIYILLGLAVIVLAVRLNTMRLKRQNRSLEHLILERTNEIIQQKEEIAAQKEELQSNNEQLIDLNNEKNYYIGVVAHDLKSPLNRISALVGLIRKEAGDIGQRPQEYLSMISSSVEEQRRLITDILDLQAIESKSIDFNMKEVDLVSLLQEMVGELKVTAAEKSIEVHFTHQSPELHVLAEPNYMRQVIGNLFSNALKFSPEQTNVFIHAENRKGRVKLSVKDEGPGISKEDQQKLFRKFQKLSAQPTAGERSTGLGLSIVKKFSEAMGARVWCKSKLGKGATFILEMDEYRGEDAKKKIDEGKTSPIASS